jgi:hypothetical protein
MIEGLLIAALLWLPTSPTAGRLWCSYPPSAATRSWRSGW